MASSDFMQDSLAFMESSVVNAKMMNLVTLVLMLVEGFAVFMMFKLNKMGFWIYTLVQVVLIGVTIYFVPWPNVLSTMTVGFYGIIVLLFLILYGVNLKHMK